MASLPWPLSGNLAPGQGHLPRQISVLSFADPPQTKYLSPMVWPPVRQIDKRDIGSDDEEGEPPIVPPIVPPAPSKEDDPSSCFRLYYHPYHPVPQFGLEPCPTAAVAQKPSCPSCCGARPQPCVQQQLVCAARKNTYRTITWRAAYAVGICVQEGVIMNPRGLCATQSWCVDGGIADVSLCRSLVQIAVPPYHPLPIPHTRVPVFFCASLCLVTDRTPVRNCSGLCGPERLNVRPWRIWT